MAQSQLNTRIVLRNDSIANWEAASSVVLLKGEVGVAFLENGEARLKIGDGVSTWAELNWCSGGTGGNAQLAADGKSIVVSNDVLALLGFEAAEIGACPVKGEDGTLQWKIPAEVEVDELKETVKELQTQVIEIHEIILPSEEGSAPLITRIEELEEKMNGTGEDSIDARIDAKIEAFANELTDDGKVNTLLELIQYVDEHGGELAGIIADIDGLKEDVAKMEELVGDKPLADVVAEALAQENFIKEIAVNGVLCEVVNGRVDLTIDVTGTGVVSGDEIAVNEDGTLSIVKLDMSKLVVDESTTIVLNGGSASI